MQTSQKPQYSTKPNTPSGIAQQKDKHANNGNSIPLTPM